MNNSNDIIKPDIRKIYHKKYTIFAILNIYLLEVIIIIIYLAFHKMILSLSLFLSEVFKSHIIQINNIEKTSEFNDKWLLKSL